ncbi:uncharacterized protein LOC131878405 isoform X1 [Tigriopus californicus]|uniref:uncharacterized protein LOC131878405 isoform X1 n=2 Tax=Tigriopus californicus TaxID=6832 RepID=UPI0027D9D9CA|nr:uncharacterized protein LOC131878405 isoform X1 [Tigriopus californicus]
MCDCPIGQSNDEYSCQSIQSRRIIYRTTMKASYCMILGVVFAFGAQTIQANPRPQGFFFPESIDETETNGTVTPEPNNESSTEAIQSGIVFGGGDEDEKEETVDKKGLTRFTQPNEANQTKSDDEDQEEQPVTVSNDPEEKSSEVSEPGPEVPEDVADSCSPFELPGFNKTTQEWSCFSITTQGPCADSEWFILDKNFSDYPKGICVERPCAEGQVLYQDTCEAVSSLADCPFNMEILPNPFGEGECDCFEGLAAVLNETLEEFSCYPEFSPEPCSKPDQQLLKVNGSAGSFECQDTPCQSGERLFQEECLAEIDCKSTDNVDEKIISTFCNFGIRQLLTLPEKCDGNKARDYQGNCKEEFSFGKRASRPRRLANQRFRRSAFANFY